MAAPEVSSSSLVVAQRNSSISISHFVHPSQMPKQGEMTGFDNGGEWRLLSHSTDDIIPDEVIPSNVQDPLQTPLVECVNSQHISLVYRPGFSEQN